MSIVYETELSANLIAALEDAHLPAEVVVRRNKHGKWVGFWYVNYPLFHLLQTIPLNSILQRVSNHLVQGCSL